MKKTHGGARKGAGRPVKENPRQLVNFTLSAETIARLRRTIAARARSAFVEMAILKALG